MSKKSEFKELQSIWYAKLSRSGFTDIESDEFNVKRWSYNIKQDSITHKAKEEYYQLAERFLNEFKFKNRREKIIWEYHSNGISVRDIADLLTRLISPPNKSTVGAVVKRLKEIMKDMYLVKSGK